MSNPSPKQKRTIKGFGSIRYRSDGWDGRYTIGPDSGTGKLIQKSISGKTQKEVRQKLQRITLEIDKGTCRTIQHDGQ